MLYDVSIVNRGAYPQTSIALRARDAAKADDEKRENDRREHNQAAYLRRKAEQEQKFRHI